MATSRRELTVVGVSKRFGEDRVLDDVNLVADGGEIVALTGENGAGKSTLIKICAGLIRPDSGTVTVADGVGYCPQTPGLFELLSTDEHLAMFGRGLGLSRAVSLARGRATLDELEFTAPPAMVTSHMSGGLGRSSTLPLRSWVDLGCCSWTSPTKASIVAPT